MSSDFLSYVAGFFDAEGTVGVWTRAGYYSMVVAIGQQRPCPVFDRLRQEFGGSIIQGKKQVLHWRIGDNKAVGFLKEIQPYLRLPRKIAQCRLAIEFQERRHKAGCQSGGITDQEMEYRQQIYHKLRHLKTARLDYKGQGLPS